MPKQTRRRQLGGYQTSQQWFDPSTYPPSAGMFTGSTDSDSIRPVMISTFKGGARSRRRKHGGGYQMSQQWFDPSTYPPSAGMFAGSTASNNSIRPELLSTFSAASQSGGRSRSTSRRSTSRRSHMSGGFSPSVMGGFVANAQAAAVPLALYLAYHMLPKKGKRGSKTKRASRN